MYFILNKGIKFTPETNELSLIPDGKNGILISNAASRLLVEMVRNANEVVSRDVLLQKVWEDYGFKTSYNNLYMAVSEIRKTFEILGCNKTVIITIPKVGIKLVADIDIFDASETKLKPLFSEELSKVTPEVPSSNDTFSDPNIDNPTEDKFGSDIETITLSAKNKNYLYRWILPLLIMVLSMTIFYYQLNKKLGFSPLVQYDVFDYRSCRIYIINSSVGYNLTLLKEKALKNLNDNHVDCGSEKKSIYFQDNFIRSGKINEYTLGVCSRSPGKNKCETIKSLAG